MNMFRGRPRKDLIRRHGALAPRALEGLNIAIIGGTNGIGRALALAALAKGAKVKVGGRTSRDATTPGLSFVAADLKSLMILWEELLSLCLSQIRANISLLFLPPY